MRRFLIALCLGTTLLLSVPASAAVVEPTAGTACTIKTTGPITGSTDGTSVVQPAAGNNMVCVGGTWQYPNYILANAAAAAGTSCSSSPAGTLRYNTTLSSIEFCNGTTWAQVPAAATACGAPSGLSFTNLTSQPLNTVVSSGTATITWTGCSGAYVASVSGAATAQISINGGAWTTSGAISSGQTLQVQMTTSTSGSTVLTATVTVGGTSTNWTTTTAALNACTGTASSPTIGQECVDGTVYAGLTPDGNVPMYTTHCDVGQTWSGSACTGTRATKKWSYGTSVTTGITSSNTGKSNTASLYALNANADGPYEAATYCKTLSQNGYTDWYLPALGELALLYTNKTAIGNFDTTGTYYWSSSEANNYSAYGQRFSDGYQKYNYDKNNTYLVRCARR